MISRILTVPEVARILRISRTKAYQEVRSGRLPSFQLGRTVRVRESDLERWIEEQVTRSVIAVNTQYKD